MKKKMKNGTGLIISPTLLVAAVLHIAFGPKSLHPTPPRLCSIMVNRNRGWSETSGGITREESLWNRHFKIMSRKSEFYDITISSWLCTLHAHATSPIPFPAPNTDLWFNMISYYYGQTRIRPFSHLRNCPRWLCHPRRRDCGFYMFTALGRLSVFVVVVVCCRWWWPEANESPLLLVPCRSIEIFGTEFVYFSRRRSQSPIKLWRL